MGARERSAKGYPESRLESAQERGREKAHAGYLGAAQAGGPQSRAREVSTQTQRGEGAQVLCGADAVDGDGD